MAGVWLRVAAWARANWPRTVPVVLIVALAGAAAFALVAGIRRTETAPSRLTAAFGGDPDLVLLQPAGDPLTSTIAALPGVLSAKGLTFVAAFPIGEDGSMAFEANPFAGEEDFFGTAVLEGRFTEGDHIVVGAGAGGTLTFDRADREEKVAVG